MLIKFRKASDVKSSEITPKSVYMDRRRFIKSAGFMGAGALLGAAALPLTARKAEAAKMIGVKKSTKYTEESVGDALTSLEHITKYNNFYEFGTGKTDPQKNAQEFKPKPWTVKVEGHVKNKGTYAYEDLIRPHQLEERVYRFRCVEAWSMVVPWVGIPLADIIKKLEPTSRAKYVYFETLFDPERMPGQRRPVLQWPYKEGLRMDEAMNPLTMLVNGVYGEEIPNQNGAPIRLITPWKYGFKSIKSIVTIKFTERQPPTSWSEASPREYGFYSNVNPLVNHPRWSQASERVIGGGFFSPRKPTHMFNGYEEEVASMYAKMNLTKNF